jgi:hypothetical protein
MCLPDQIDYLASATKSYLGQEGLARVMSSLPVNDIANLNLFVDNDADEGCLLALSQKSSRYYSANGLSPDRLRSGWSPGAIDPASTSRNTYGVRDYGRTAFTGY